MKKIFYLTGIILVLFTSCSSDNSEPDLQEPVLVKEIEINYNGSILKEKFLYDGNKIKSIIYPDGSVSNYTYTNDLITKIEEVNVQGNLSSVREYSYSDGKLFSILEIVYNSFIPYYDNLKKYVYNSDNTVTCQKYKVNSTTGLEEDKDGLEQTIYFKDGNIVKQDFDYGYSNVYEYDAKNTIYKNILNFRLLLDLEPSVNNRTKTIAFYKGEKTNETINLFEYNSKGYPTKNTIDAANTVPFSVLKYIY